VADPEPIPYERLPGCGFGVYVLVLAVLCVAGIAGMFFSLWVLHVGGAELAPNRVSYGGVVDPANLQPMREAGLLAADEIPDIFHAEAMGGTPACAVSNGKLLRVDGGQGSMLPLSALGAVTASEHSFTAAGPPAITCTFLPGEGGDRFARMLGADVVVER
jgi:hypothetical protein